jgi:flagellar biosynthesis chaperone FliJ
MSRFRFSLDVVLRLRERREQSARQQVARSRAQCDAALAEVERLQSAVTRQDRWHRLMLEDEPARGFVNRAFSRDLVDGLRLQLSRRSEELRAAQERAARDRATLLEAMRRRQSMERLRARRLRTHLAMAHRLETAEREDAFGCQTGMAFQQDFRLRLLGGVSLPGQRPPRRQRELVAGLRDATDPREVAT